MNQTEKAYNALLTLRLQAGEVLWYKFEGLKLRLADNTFYTPDFAVLAADSVMECHEVKGHWTDDARAKIKIAADMYPFRFLAVKKARKRRAAGGFRRISDCLRHKICCNKAARTSYSISFLTTLKAPTFGKWRP